MSVSGSWVHSTRGGRRGQLAALFVLALARPAAADQVVDVRSEYLSNPIGLDVARPRFSWVMESFRRGARQTAYRVLVSRDARALLRDEPDLWDSGRIESGENAQIEYAGPELAPRTRYHVRVDLWDERGQRVRARPAFFETGLLDGKNIRASFIGLRPGGDDERMPFVGARWFWAPPDVVDDKTKALGFVYDFDIADAKDIERADLFIVVPGDGRNWIREGSYFLRLNDHELPRLAATTNDPRQIPIAPALRTGKNRMSLRAPAWVGRKPAPVALFTIRVRLRDGRLRFVQSDGTGTLRVAPLAQALPGDEPEPWRTSDAQKPPFVAARVLGPFGDAVIPDDPATAGIDRLVPAAYLRRAFAVRGRVKRARLYATAAGIYEMYLNGKRVGDDVLSPGWTDFHKRLYYRTHDVTALLSQGRNMLGGIVADGWFVGRTGIGQHIYGFEKALLAELHIDYADGRSEVVATDGAWEGATGPIRKADLLDGQLEDGRRNLPGWSSPALPAAGHFRPVHLPSVQVGRLVGHPDPPVRVVRTLNVKRVSQPAPGVQIFDLGQNMVGWIKLRLAAARDTRITVRYGEMLNPDGSLFTDNLRTALATDEYIAAGRGLEIFEPRFTFHGFRYVEIRGLAQPLSAAAVTGMVVASDLPATGSFHTGHPLLDQLQSNIVWGQRGNYLSIPTDCPQRDERLGWTGDIQMFARTGAFNMDSAAFLSKYLVDLEDAQLANGEVSNVAPALPVLGGGAYGWGDAMVILPDLLWRTYGDTRVIRRHFEAMKRWVDARTRRAKKLLDTHSSFGDWLAPRETPHKVLGPIYHAHVAARLSAMAAAIDKPADAERYGKLARDIRAAFSQAFVDHDGKIESDTQTAYVLALRYDMLPKDLRARAAQHLRAAIAKAGGHLATGFLGTGHLLPALSGAGHDDEAYRLLLTETYPSWLYTVKNGATTMWERWDSYDPVKGPNNKGDMNSYNHYAFGAVGEWMYETIAGIAADPARPGFAALVIRPRPGGGLERARALYRSIRGTVATNWRIVPVGGRRQFVLDVKVPVHARATVHVPVAENGAVSEGGRPVEQAPGVKAAGRSAGVARFEVGAGEYQFRAPLP